MRALIIEDEYPAAERLTKLIRKIDPDIELLGVLGSIAAATRWFAEQRETPPDLIFSDIQLSDGLSFEIFEEVTVKSPIIFTTSYDEYALKAFKVKSIDYLLKPIKPQELAQAIEKFKESQASFAANEYTRKIQSLLDHLPQTGRKYKTRFLVEQQEELLPVSEDEIAYFYTTNELVCLVRRDNRQFLVDYTLEELERLLDPRRFFRLNRQYLSSLFAVRKIHTYFNGKLKLELQPEPPQEILVSREKSGSFKHWMEGE